MIGIVPTAKGALDVYPAWGDILPLKPKLATNVP